MNELIFVNLKFDSYQNVDNSLNIFIPLLCENILQTRIKKFLQFENLAELFCTYTRFLFDNQQICI